MTSLLFCLCGFVNLSTRSAHTRTNELQQVVNEVVSVDSTTMSVRPSGLPPIQEMPPPGGFRKVREVDVLKRDENDVSVPVYRVGCSPARGACGFNALVARTFFFCETTVQ
jgi:hypothetical protein